MPFLEVWDSGTWLFECLSYYELLLGSDIRAIITAITVIVLSWSAPPGPVRCQSASDVMMSVMSVFSTEALELWSSEPGAPELTDDDKGWELGKLALGLFCSADVTTLSCESCDRISLCA